MFAEKQLQNAEWKSNWTIFFDRKRGKPIDKQQVAHTLFVSTALSAVCRMYMCASLCMCVSSLHIDRKPFSTFLLLFIRQQVVSLFGYVLSALRVYVRVFFFLFEREKTNRRLNIFFECKAKGCVFCYIDAVQLPSDFNIVPQASSYAYCCGWFGTNLNVTRCALCEWINWIACDR